MTKDCYLRAINAGEFQAYIQPIVDAKTESSLGGELLARWNHPDQGILNPGYFIDEMVSCGAISSLDLFIFEEACRIQQRLQSSGEHMALACNFTRASLCDPMFIDNMAKIIKKYNIDYSHIIIELTEVVVESDKNAAIAEVKTCKEAGCSVAIDDMGSGCSSASDLVDYPVDIVKIDRSILLGAKTRKGLRKLRHLISSAHKCGARTVGEGVETEDDVRLLKSLNCDMLQGFYFGKPVPVAF